MPSQLSARSSYTSTLSTTGSSLPGPAFPNRSLPYYHTLARRANTPSVIVNAGSSFQSRSKRFKYHGRSKPKETYPESVHQLLPSARPAKYQPSSPLAPSDTRSESITGMTFARAMGYDETVHSPKKQSRDITTPLLCDYEAYDWRLHDGKRRTGLGYAMDRVPRSVSDQFMGTSWRGCANVIPSNCLTNPDPSSYGKQIPMGDQPANQTAVKIMRSTANARGSMDSLNIGAAAVCIPTAKAATSDKLGPGYYKASESKNAMKRRGTVLNDTSKEGSCFKTIGREARLGSTVDVFATANNSRKDEGDKARGLARGAGGTVTMTSGATTSTGTGHKGGAGGNTSGASSDPYSMYENISPKHSQTFLKMIERNDNFHAVLKKEKKEGEGEEASQYREKAFEETKKAAKVRELWERLESTELLLKEDLGDIEIVNS